MKFSRISIFVAASLMVCTGLRAEKYLKAKENEQESKKYFKTLVADCGAPESQVEMAINNVRTTILSGGDMWWNLNDARYEIPKIPAGDPTISVHSLFAGAIWISGLDDGGNLKLAAQTYRQGGTDYWPGPLDNSGNTERATCREWDRHFSVFGKDVDALVTLFADPTTTSVSLNDVLNISADLVRWPGRGNPYAPDYIGYNVPDDQNIAPFYDRDGDQIYDPTKGDYPVIDANPRCGPEEVSFADQMIFWVYNDNGNIHGETGGDAIGIQVNALAFAYQTSDEINDMTFYKYDLELRSSTALSQTYMGQYADGDLGCAFDDYVGCDTSRDLGILYSGYVQDNEQGNCSGTGDYGINVPILGIDFFEGPADTSGKELGMSSFVYYNNSTAGIPPGQTDPQIAAEFRNYMTGKWRDGNNIEFGGDGYLEGTFPFTFMFPNSPNLAGGWSENQVGNQPADRRFLQNSGPFVLLPGAAQKITVGVVWVMLPPGSHPNLSFETTIAPADDKAQALFDNCFKLIDGPDAPTLKIIELDEKVIINMVNLPGSNNTGENYEETDPLIVAAINALAARGDTNFVYDTTYRFQGYKLYQVSASNISPADLDDQSQARLILQCDIKDGVADIINFTKDLQVNSNVGTIEVQGTNEGIVHSIEVSEDQFSSESPNLVNHKIYYFAAISYAYNNYKTFDPENPSVGGQMTPYLQGRGNFRVYSGIPHKYDPRNMGTVLNSTFGQGVELTRVEGRGNGGFNLELTDSTVDRILTSPFNQIFDIKYKPRSGPVDVKVIDPINVKDGFYELRFLTTDTIRDELNEADTAFWVLYYNGTAIDTSNVTRFNEDYEELIIFNDPVTGEEINYGLSIKIGGPSPVFTNVDNGNNVYPYLTSSIEFKDPLQDWMSFIVDEEDGQFSVTNWIRSGKDTIEVGEDLERIYDDAYRRNVSVGFRFMDPDKQFESMVGGTWAPYCLTAMYSEPRRTLSVSGQIRFSQGPAFYINALNLSGNPSHTFPENNLDELASVDIVLTSDKSKWSKCIVFETGETQIFNRNTVSPRLNASKGDIKLELTKDENGVVPFPGVIGDAEWSNILNRYPGDVSTFAASISSFVSANYGRDMGRSFFPGYAINLETGERLNIAFGESSELAGQNGRDMLWNPNDEKFSPANVPLNNVLYGGKHYIYVFKTKYDEGQVAKDTLLKYFGESSIARNGRAQVYDDLMYTALPYLTEPGLLKSFEDGLVPTDVTIKLRVVKPYTKFETDNTFTANTNESWPYYSFTLSGYEPTENDNEVATSALDLIRAVPNPYYAYSAYESSQLDNRIKIINLPNQCTISIYTIDGQLVKQIERNIGPNIELTDGANVTNEELNYTNATEWNLKNTKNVPVASGVYLIHIDAPGIGERTIKWFGAMRPVDLRSF